MTLGPDGATPYLAVRGAGVWYVGSGHTVHHVPGVRLSSRVQTYALQSDPQGADLYAATSHGLYRRHQNATYNVYYQGNRWVPVRGVPNAAIAAIRPTRGGLLAIAADGTTYEGTRKGQALTWRPLRRSVPRSAAPVGAALVGAEWQAPPLPTPLPVQFTQNCVQVGPSNPFDVCGPFRQFYLHFKDTILGFPRELATVTAHGTVRQAFENVALEWTPARGVFLAPLGRIAAAGRVFPHPTRQQIQQAYTPLVDGYYVEPVFYQFWLQNSLHGVSIFGNPISQLLTVPSPDGTGRPALVQYFTNARLEYHRDYLPGSPFRLSPLGLQIDVSRY
jgi:hypothetical protein